MSRPGECGCMVACFCGEADCTPMDDACLDQGDSFVRGACSRHVVPEHESVICCRIRAVSLDVMTAVVLRKMRWVVVVVVVSRYC